MRRRLGLAVLALAALVALAGCAGLGGGGIDEERLAENATYEWSTDAAATYNVTDDEYYAIYDVENGTTLEVYRLDDLGTEQSVAMSALKFRYPNGTVVGVEEIDVSQDGERTIVEPPAERGRLAYTAPTPPKSFRTPILVEGSHEVILPRGVRIEAFLFGSISPDGYTTTTRHDRVHVRWAETPGSEIALRYYLERDFYIVVGLAAALVVVGALGVVYYRIQIRKLERRREQVDWDADDGAN